MAFVWGTEMLKSLKIKWMTVDLGWLYNTFDKVGFQLASSHYVEKQVHNQTSREICQYQNDDHCSGFIFPVINWSMCYNSKALRILKKKYWNYEQTDMTEIALQWATMMNNSKCE